MDRQSETLAYGAVQRFSVRRKFRRLLGAAVLAAVCARALHEAGRRAYCYERDSVVATLEAIPGVRVGPVTGFDEDFSFSVIDAEVALGADPAKTITFNSPNAREMRRGNRMRVQVAPYGFCAVPTNDGGCYSPFLELGRDGEFGKLLPFEVAGPEDLVRGYDEVVTALGQLPPSGFHRGRSGTLYYYWIGKAGQWPPTWEQMLNAARAGEAQAGAGVAASGPAAPQATRSGG